jgi:nucleotide-binding universal stress UspA family protein
VSRALLLCFDGSEEAAEAIRTAGMLMPGRDALALCVAIPAHYQLGIGPASAVVGRMSGLYREWDETATEVAEREAAKGCELACEVGLRARALVACGKPAPTIVRLADDYDVAAIVVGAGHHGALGRLLGSVSARVSHEAARPVLVVRGSGPGGPSREN